MKVLKIPNVNLNRGTYSDDASCLLGVSGGLDIRTTLLGTKSKESLRSRSSDQPLSFSDWSTHTCRGRVRCLKAHKSEV